MTALTPIPRKAAITAIQKILRPVRVSSAVAAALRAQRIIKAFFNTETRRVRRRTEKRFAES
jgi:predicted dinucleotide-binding enzyme